MPFRVGECNRCGQCCGSPGSPYRDSPWPDPWPEALRTWRVSTIEGNLPVVLLAGFPPLGGPRAFAVRVANRTYRGIWVEGHGLCADAPPWGDPSAFEEMCPFLMAQQPDGTYPCALVGTRWEYIWTAMCEGEPPMEKTAEQVAQWQQRHPLCSYTWE